VTVRERCLGEPQYRKTLVDVRDGMGRGI
jgi:hypothetical protein